MDREDRGEPLSGMEPLLIHETSRHRAALNELAFELTRLSAGFREAFRLQCNHRSPGSCGR